MSAGATVFFPLPETNSLTHLKMNGWKWLEDDPFLLERPIFRGYVGFKEGKYE